MWLNFSSTVITYRGIVKTDFPVVKAYNSRLALTYERDTQSSVVVIVRTCVLLYRLLLSIVHDLYYILTEISLENSSALYSGLIVTGKADSAKPIHGVLYYMQQTGSGF